MTLRIVSFLPAATEMVGALGLIDQLVGVSHECDWPEAAKSRPVVVRSALDTLSMDAAEIDVVVTARLREGKSLYVVDEDRLRAARPTHILTQNLCEVCAPSGNELSRALALLDAKPEVIFMTPRTLDGIRDNIRELAQATHTQERAEALFAEWDKRVADVRRRLAGCTPVKAFFMEWVDPIYCSGHWMDEMIRTAGGVDSLTRPGTDSVRIAWEDVLAAAPEVLIVGPCGFHTKDAAKQMALLTRRPGWGNLPAVKNHRVYAVDANGYFARPGPRVAQGIELLAHLFHPNLCDWRGDAKAFITLYNNGNEKIP